MVYYRQRDIVEFDVQLNDGKIIPAFGLIIGDNSKMRFYDYDRPSRFIWPANDVILFRVSKDMSAFDPNYHRQLEDSFMESPIETPCYVTTSIERIMDEGNRITRIVNRMKPEEFDRTLAWATSIIGHRWLWLTNPIQ